jgi:hypothetical protein
MDDVHARVPLIDSHSMRCSARTLLNKPAWHEILFRRLSSDDRVFARSWDRRSHSVCNINSRELGGSLRILPCFPLTESGVHCMYNV